MLMVAAEVVRGTLARMVLDRLATEVLLKNDRLKGKADSLSVALATARYVQDGVVHTVPIVYHCRPLRYCSNAPHTILMHHMLCQCRYAQKWYQKTQDRKIKEALKGAKDGEVGSG
jgi:hypothetical protein